MCLLRSRVSLEVVFFLFIPSWEFLFDSEGKLACPCRCNVSPEISGHRIRFRAQDTWDEGEPPSSQKMSRYDLIWIIDFFYYLSFADKDTPIPSPCPNKRVEYMLHNMWRITTHSFPKPRPTYHPVTMITSVLWKIIVHVLFCVCLFLQKVLPLSFY